MNNAPKTVLTLDIYHIDMGKRVVFGWRKLRQDWVKRLTHYDLRHLFATRCIENGVDIPTVSSDIRTAAHCA